MHIQDVSTKMKEYLNLIRIRQWYKNLVVFLAIFFSGRIMDLDLLVISSVAFIALCLISSAGYIINDMKDRKKDQLHTEKKNRPLASGKISRAAGGFVALLFLVSGMWIASNLGGFFLYSMMALFGLSLVYSIFLKRIIFADVLTIATLFVIRAISGALAINVLISPWLILGPFFLSLFLSIGKRHAELHLTKSELTREVLKEYNHGLTNSLMIMSTTLLTISYALYSFLSEYNYLIYSIPFALYVIFRYYYLIVKGSDIARAPEKVIKDKAMIIGMLLWIVITGVIIYG
jgi:4-hydroxybenzoate polyprenyltransferase